MLKCMAFKENYAHVAEKTVRYPVQVTGLRKFLGGRTWCRSCNAVLQKISALLRSDGWFFSGNWKNCMKALLEPEVDLWVRCLNDAMEGWGTDENSLTALVCTIPERLRIPIFKKYYEKTGKGLLEHIESDTSFSYKKARQTQSTVDKLDRSM